MKASVLLTLQVTESEAYKVNLNLPTEAPKPEKPFVFCVTQEITGKAGDDVLEVAIADKDHYYVGVAPPGSLLEVAHISNVVKELQVVVSEGEYDRANKKFN